MFDCFIQIADIPGESQDHKHKDWIEVLSYSKGLTQATSGSRSSSGAISAERVNFQDVTFTHALDKASPKLSLSCASGKHIPKITMELCRNTGAKELYMKYELEDSIITSVRSGGSSSGSETIPIEEVSFAFGKLTETYTETDHKTGKPKGNISFNWSLVENKGG